MKYAFLSLLFVVFAGPLSVAADPRADELFHEIFINEVLKSTPPGADVQGLHMTADANVETALSATSLEQAMTATAHSGITQLIQATPALNSCKVPARMSHRPLTLVLIPGVFAEFIDTHAFEEVFSRPSALRDQFHQQVIAAKAKDRVSLLKLHQYEAPEELTSVERDLDQVILTGQIELADGQTVRVILFNTEFSSLESLGNSRPRALLFNRRLEKYLKLTGDQDLAFVGYSRGTILGLEMLAQAKSANSTWLRQVKGMISLSGVTFGSSLADDAMNNPNAPLGIIISQLAQTSGSLASMDARKSEFERKMTIVNNTFKWTDFGRVASTQLIRMVEGMSWADRFLLLDRSAKVNPQAPTQIVKRLWSDLGLDSMKAYSDPATYNANIDRFRYFVDQLEESVKELSSEARMQWWKANAIPKEMTYYTVAAAMANPRSGMPDEARLYANPLAYGKDSYDDLDLLMNHIDYQKLSGVSLNDSQVSVAQAAFLPNVIAALNPANAGLNTKFLGVAGTHHWGMALRVVNQMRGYPPNGFPREAMLKALATQVKLDTP